MSLSDAIQICVVIVILTYCIWRVIRALIRVYKRPDAGECSGCVLAESCNKPKKALSDRTECKKSDKDLHNSKD